LPLTLFLRQGRYFPKEALNQVREAAGDRTKKCSLGNKAFIIQVNRDSHRVPSFPTLILIQFPCPLLMLTDWLKIHASIHLLSKPFSLINNYTQRPPPTNHSHDLSARHRTLPHLNSPMIPALRGTSSQGKLSLSTNCMDGEVVHLSRQILLQETFSYLYF